MKRFDVFKTIQLVFLGGLTLAALYTVLRDPVLYAKIAEDPHVRRLCLILWLLLGVSFVSLFYDFSSYADMKRENTELDNAIYSDALTGIANRYSVDVYLGQYLHKPLPPDMGCITLDLHSLQEINAASGHAGGDEAIQAFAEILQKAASGVCFIGRNGGAKFLVIFRECTERRLERFLDGVREGTEAWNASHPVPLRYSSGKAFEEGEKVHTLTELVALSDRRAFREGLTEEKR